jgi:putative hydrolase of the HAD superfamily
LSKATVVPARRCKAASARARVKSSSGPVWLFDLDNTLHDATRAAFTELRLSMTAYIETELGVSTDEANHLRVHYWRRYGATLLGLVRHHGVAVSHFLHQTHHLPGLEERLHAPAGSRQALRRLGGTRLILTNAPRAYALRVLNHLGLASSFDALLSIEDMVMFGRLRPKPDTRMFRRLAVRLGVPACRCILVEDTLEHQKAAQRVGMGTVWMQGFLKPTHGDQPAHQPSQRLFRKPAYVDRRIQSLNALRRTGRPLRV